MQDVIVRKGIHVGRSHLLNFVNRQDSVSFYDGLINGTRTIIGIICDGCSEGNASEVGATLAVSYLIREVTRLCEEGVPMNRIPTVLYTHLLSYLNLILVGYPFKNPADRVNFIKHHLLFTVVGFIATETETIVFLTGDGSIIINDEIYLIESDNKPMYPAYHLVDRSALESGASELPASFDVWEVDRSTLKRLAIGSDAWHGEQDLISEIWGFKNPAGLQRRLNQWSRERRFSDDVSIVTLEIVEVPQPEEEVIDGRND